MNALSKNNSRTLYWIGIIVLFSTALALLLWHLDSPSEYVYDEFHYVPAAKSFIELQTPKNLEHPPLGKILIAGGIKIWGDNPWGWRLPSFIAGMLSLGAVAALSQMVLGANVWALLCVFFTLINGIFVVQARTAMLDTFLVAWLLLSLSFAMGWARSGFRSPFYFMCIGVCWGLALATKWSAVFIAPPLLLLFFQDSRRGWGVRGIRFLFCTGLALLTYYSVSGVYLLFAQAQYGFFDLFWKLPMEMIRLQKNVAGAHSYKSNWWEWPLLLRPMWYYTVAKEASEPGYFKGIICLGNPLLMWSGFLSILWMILSFFKKRVWEKVFLVLVWLTCWLGWIFQARRISFYYYYYPSAMILGILLVYFLKDIYEWALHKGEFLKLAYWGLLVIFLTAHVFIFWKFLPIYLGIAIPNEEFYNLMWFRSWI